MRLFRRLLFNRVNLGAVMGIALVYGGYKGNQYTSSDEFCASCHVHPHVSKSWKRSPHFDNRTGVFVHCVECHLPPGGLEYLSEKARTGLRDVYGKLFKDFESIDWDERSRLEHARHYTYKSACVDCHENIFPLGMSLEGDEAHLHYSQHEDELRCINCHLSVGHDKKKAGQKPTFGLAAVTEGELYTEPTRVESFEDFTETIPASRVSFEMVALPGGAFVLGSPDSEAYREEDEGPPRTVRLSRFWMAKTEVTWNEYLAFYAQTASEGRTDTRALSASPSDDVDAITGATPPYGDPDQGWGKGTRPAITMTYHAAETYCRWLSMVTGKRYRLPTEAEWEYACRGGSDSPYFFEGSPKDFSERGLWNRLFGADTEPIGSLAIYAANAGGRTQPSETVEGNPFGLLNMSGNVAELCLDWYAPDAYAQYPDGEVVVDPRGPEEGTEHVVRGGSFRSDAAALRSAARDHTRHDAWMMTDPQIPKSLWWYSDCITVGFRVVCEDDLMEPDGS